MKRKLSFVFILAVVMTMALVACGKDQEDENKQTAKKENKSEVYTIEHAMGSTDIEGTPKKIVILTNEGIEALLAMGVKPVGAVKPPIGDSWYKHLADELEGVQVVGTELEVNLEAIAKLEPDLIIGNKMRHEKIYDHLNGIAPTVFAETLRGEWQDNFKLYAKAINKEKEGKKVLDEYNQRISSLKEKLGAETKKEISMVRFMPGDVRIYHKDSFSGVILDQLGFARPAEQDKDDFAERNVTKERIPAMDGDMIFYFVYDTGDGEATKAAKDWINDPLFQNLHATKKGNVHQVDDVIWNTAGGVLAANLMLDDIEEIFLK